MTAANGDPPLFELPPDPPAPIRHGRRRRELDADIKAAADAGARLPRSGVASLRDLAEGIDAIVRAGRAADAEPGKLAWHLATLNREWRATYALTFGDSADDDPFARDLPGSPAAGEPAAPLGAPAPLDSTNPRATH